MPIHLSWDDTDQTILLNQSSGRWTWEEYHLALGEMIDRIKGVNHRVDVITVRLPDAVHPPGSGLPHYQRAMRVLPDNTGLHVLINTSTIARITVSTFLRFYPQQAHGMVALAASIEEARALIAKDRAKSHPAAINRSS